MDYPIISPKKLIEVALPLDKINAAAALEKQPFTRRHPRSLHIWWARRPFTAARAVIFAQLVNDPGFQQGAGFKYGKNKKDAAIERRRLFKIIEDLVLWDSSTNEDVLEAARVEIRRSWREVCELNKNHPRASELFNPEKLPALHDPFAGGGAIPLESQRLGLSAYASDLNPVAVIINKAMLEIPPKFAGCQPIGPEGPTATRGKKLPLNEAWPRASGLIEDAFRYGSWIYSEAKKRIGYLYPQITITVDIAGERPDLKPFVGKQMPVIAWFWARSVKCPNPACGCITPLLSSYVLSTKKGKEAYVIPSLTKDGTVDFQVTLNAPTHLGDLSRGLKRGMSGIFECVACKTVTSRDYTAAEANHVGLGVIPTAVVCDGPKGRVFLSPKYAPPLATHTPSVDTTGLAIEFAANPRDVWCRNFGLKSPVDLFTTRQLVALTTLSDLITETREKIHKDALAAGMNDDNQGLDAGGTGARAYAEAVSVYLAIAVSRWTDLNNALCTWNATNNNVRALFSRQAIPMSWDFVELSAFSPIAGFDSVLNSLKELSVSLPASIGGSVEQADAQNQRISLNKAISTDPPYYDNIGYADLSDFFYVWLRRSLRSVFPTLFSTIAVPKDDELVAKAYRHGNKESAERFFLTGMTRAMRSLVDQSHPEPPLTIYYAFKQSDTSTESGTSSTGWETFLNAVIHAGLQLTGTWPMRTERETRSTGIGTNSLASSIILVCRKRSINAPTISRREFLRELNAVLPQALDEMTRGAGAEQSPVAPVDLSQAIIGPGMAVFSKYSSVLEADGTPMTIKTALQLINRFLAEDDFDADTQFCLHWFEQYGWETGKFGEADTLARAKGTSVDGVKQAGVLHSASGNVRLLKWAEYPSDWDAKSDNRLPVWEFLHQLIRVFNTEGESGAAAVFAAVQSKAEPARQLAYRLYTLCERKNWAEDARAYNEVVTSWSGIESDAAKETSLTQRSLFDN